MLTVLNAVGAAVGLLSSVAVALLFGTSRELEVYFAALTLYTVVLSLTQFGTLTEIFMPIYHRVKYGSGQEEAFHVFSVVTNWLLLFCAILTVVAWIGAPLIVQMLVPGFSASDHELGRRMFRWIAPLVCIRVYLVQFQTLSNAERWYGWPESLNVVAQIVSLAVIVLFASRWGAWAIVVSLWVGQLLLFLMYQVIARRLGYRHDFAWHAKGIPTRRILGQMTSSYTYVGANQFYQFIISAGLSLLPQGTYAVYHYVRQVYTKVVSVLLRPVTIVFFTDVSQAIAAGAAEVRRLTSTALARVLAIAVPVLVAAIVAGRQILEALWGGARFGAEELDLATRFLVVFFGVSLLAGQGLVARRINAALDLIQSQYLIAGALRAITAILAWFLMSRYGTIGALIGIGGAEAVNNLAYLLPARLWRPRFLARFDGALLLRWGFVAVVGISVGLLAITWPASHLLPLGRLGLIGGGTVSCAVAWTAMAATGHWLGIHEVSRSLEGLRALGSSLRARLAGAS